MRFARARWRPRIFERRRPTAINDALPRAAAHFSARLGILDQLFDRGGERICVVRFGDEAVYAVLDQFRGAAEIGDDGGKPQAWASMMTLPKVSVVLGKTKIRRRRRPWRGLRLRGNRRRRRRAALLERFGVGADADHEQADGNFGVAHCR